MKTLTFAPINETRAVVTGTNILQALLAHELDVLMACGGKGMCATCHVRIDRGMDKLTPRTPRETRTLGFVTGASESSRLACQCRILGEGVVVQLPEGMYIERAEDLLALLGQRAERDILHPINGSVLIAKGKIITRTRLEELKRLNAEVESIKNQS
ncbi:MAG: 2Fe-2S iron-sulfur cluster binding domain-containing protein [Gemmataceae bacterium]|nr:2Fe-2S iron-sulfur cluster binding domain-containing protein [Gemmataceae bacterium]